MSERAKCHLCGRREGESHLIYVVRFFVCERCLRAIEARHDRAASQAG